MYSVYILTQTFIERIIDNLSIYSELWFIWLYSTRLELMLSEQQKSTCHKVYCSSITSIVINVRDVVSITRNVVVLMFWYSMTSFSIRGSVLIYVAPCTPFAYEIDFLRIFKYEKTFNSIGVQYTYYSTYQPFYFSFTSILIHKKIFH